MITIHQRYMQTNERTDVMLVACEYGMSYYAINASHSRLYLPAIDSCTKDSSSLSTCRR